MFSMHFICHWPPAVGGSIGENDLTLGGEKGRSGDPWSEAAWEAVQGHAYLRSSCER